MESYLNKIKSKEDLKELFIEGWNWDNPSLADVFYDFPEEISKSIEKTEIIAEKLDYKVLFFDLINLENPEKKLKYFEKKVVNASDIKKESGNIIFIFSLDDFKYIDFINTEKLGPRIQLKRFSINPENRDKLRTPTEQLQKLRLDTGDISLSYIKNKVDDAFSVDLVTEKFFDEYIENFNNIKSFLKKQEIESKVEKKEEEKSK